MNLNNAYAVSNEKSYGVMVRFRNDGAAGALTGRPYTYITDIPNIEVGDDLVVMAPDFDAVDSASIPKLVKVVGLVDIADVELEGSKAIQWVVCKVDYSGWNETMQKVGDMAATIRRSQALAVRKQLLASVQQQALAVADSINDSKPE